MDDSGNILIKRVSRCGIIIKSAAINSCKLDQSSVTPSMCAISPEILKNDGRLELDKPVRLFDMKKFIQNIDRELRNSYPDRKKLENQCIILISFARDAVDILDLPSYVMIINIVAIDMLKSRIPNGSDRKLIQQQLALQSSSSSSLRFNNHRLHNQDIDTNEVVEDEDEMYASFNMEHINHDVHQSRINQASSRAAVINSKSSSNGNSSKNGDKRSPPKVPPKLPPRNFHATRTEPGEQLT